MRATLPSRSSTTRSHAIRESANEGTLLFDEIEKNHPHIMDIFLQLLDAARITIATGETLDFSGFYVVMTTNLGSAELGNRPKDD